MWYNCFTFFRLHSLFSQDIFHSIDFVAAVRWRFTLLYPLRCKLFWFLIQIYYLYYAQIIAFDIMNFNAIQVLFEWLQSHCKTEASAMHQRKGKTTFTIIMTRKPRFRLHANALFVINMWYSTNRHIAFLGNMLFLLNFHCIQYVSGPFADW